MVISSGQPCRTLTQMAVAQPGVVQTYGGMGQGGQSGLMWLGSSPLWQEMGQRHTWCWSQEKRQQDQMAMMEPMLSACAIRTMADVCYLLLAILNGTTCYCHNLFYSDCLLWHRHSHFLCKWRDYWDQVRQLWESKQAGGKLWLCSKQAGLHKVHCGYFREYHQIRVSFSVFIKRVYHMTTEAFS